MKRRHVVYGTLAVLAVVVACGLGIQAATAQDSGGSVWKEIRRISGSEPDRMVAALRETRKQYQWKPGGKAEYDAIFMAALGLEGYGANAVGVSERQEAKRALKKMFDADEVDALIDNANLTPLPEE